MCWRCTSSSCAIQLGSGIELAVLGVAHQLLDPGLVHVAGAAEHLHGVGGGADRRVGGGDLQRERLPRGGWRPGAGTRATLPSRRACRSTASCSMIGTPPCGARARTGAPSRTRGAVDAARDRRGPRAQQRQRAPNLVAPVHRRVGVGPSHGSRVWSATALSVSDAAARGAQAHLRRVHARAQPRACRASRTSRGRLRALHEAARCPSASCAPRAQATRPRAVPLGDRQLGRRPGRDERPAGALGTAAQLLRRQHQRAQRSRAARRAPCRRRRRPAPRAPPRSSCDAEPRPPSSSPSSARSRPTSASWRQHSVNGRRVGRSRGPRPRG